jgi:hypothetical protein
MRSNRQHPANNPILTVALSLGKGEGKSPLPAGGQRIKVMVFLNAAKFMNKSG